MVAATRLAFDSSLALLMAAAVAWYVAVRVAAAALARDSAAPARLAIAYWLPTALLTLLAIVVGQPEIAVASLFASSVASLSLVAGVVTLTSPLQPLAASDRRGWGLVLPAAALTLLAGFRGRLTILHAAVFAAQGAAILLFWPQAALNQRIEASSPRTSPMLLALQLILAIILSIIGALAALRGGVLIGREWELPSNTMIGSLLLGPALVIPMVGQSSLVAQRGQYSAAISALVAVTLLNLCLLLPVLIVTWNLLHAAPGQEISLVSVLGALKGQAEPPLFFPPSSWRVDTSILLVLGLWLVPVSAGRWIPGRAEGAGLVAIYAIYLTMTAYANARW